MRLTHFERAVLRELARGEIPDYTPARNVMLKLRRMGWIVGKLPSRTIAITDKGRDALAADDPS
jgi:hypothetical protein